MGHEGGYGLVKAGAVEGVRQGVEDREVGGLAAEGERAHPGGGQQLHRPPGKGLCRGHGKGSGQLQHQVGAEPGRHSGSGPFVGHGAVSPLDPVAGHTHHKGGILPCLLPGQGEVLGVSCMKGVILRHNTYDSHGAHLRGKG